MQSVKLTQLSNGLPTSLIILPCPQESLIEVSELVRTGIKKFELFPINPGKLGLKHLELDFHVVPAHSAHNSFQKYACDKDRITVIRITYWNPRPLYQLSIHFNVILQKYEVNYTLVFRKFMKFEFYSFYSYVLCGINLHSCCYRLRHSVARRMRCRPRSNSRESRTRRHHKSQCFLRFEILWYAMRIGRMSPA